MQALVHDCGWADYCDKISVLPSDNNPFDEWDVNLIDQLYSAGSLVYYCTDCIEYNMT